MVRESAFNTRTNPHIIILTVQILPQGPRQVRCQISGILKSSRNWRFTFIETAI